MSKTVTIALADGRQVEITSAGDNADLSANISYQILDAAGQPLGAPQVLAHDFPAKFGIDDPSGILVETDHFNAAPRADGGFDVFFYENFISTPSLGELDLVGFGIDVNGHAGTILERTVDLPAPGAVTPVTTPQIEELAGGRFAVTDTTFKTGPAPGVPTVHLELGGGAGPLFAGDLLSFGRYADVVLPSAPDAITYANGDITLTWNDPGGTIREVLGEDGSVLMARGVSHTFDVGVADGAVFSGFDPTHDQLSVRNPDGSIAGGTHSTLAFNAADHTLTWDPDSEGPAAATTVAILPNTTTLGVANLADSFRPEVLKVIAADGSSTIQWFDSDNSQTWDNLIATETATGAVKTYTTILDSGERTVFTFDADDSQPYTRYVDEEDAAGRVLVHSVLLDDGETWVAKFEYSEGQVILYEVDSFDATGRQVGQGFFNPDGSIL